MNILKLLSNLFTGKKTVELIHERTYRHGEWQDWYWYEVNCWAKYNTLSLSREETEKRFAEYLNNNGKLSSKEVISTTQI